MRNGEFADGAKVLRARIDMASPNINLRDPAIYRIRRAHHIRTGDKWCIYPMYDYTHCISDALEGITHSHLHAGIRGSPPAVRLGAGQHHRPLPPAPVRIFAPGAALHHHQQAQAAATGERKARERLGRPAHAHHSPACAGAATRRKASANSRAASAFPRATTSSTWRCMEGAIREDLEAARAARDGGHQSAQGDHHQLPRRAVARSGLPSQPSRVRQPPGAVLPASCLSRPTTLPKCRRQAGNGSRWAARCACATAM